MKIVGNNNFQKAANTSLILNLLRRRPSASRKEIVGELGLRASTITYITERLINGGIVRVSENDAPAIKASSRRGGRRPVQLELNPLYGQVIGLELQADYYHAVVTDLRGRPVLEQRGALREGEIRFEDRLMSAAEDFMACIDSAVPVLGMGMAIPGVVDARRRVVRDCWTHRLVDHDMSAFLDSAFRFPVVVENDANCCARHIQWSAGEEAGDSFVYLLSKLHDRRHLPPNVPAIGIGLGLILGNRLYYGYDHEAGEYQSFIRPGEGDVHWQLSLDNEKVERAGRDAGVQREIALELMGNMLFLMRILNPRSLYIGGEVGRYGDMIDDCLNGEYARSWTHLRAQGCRIEVLEDSESHPARGAAASLLEAIYTVPQVGEREQNRKLWDSLLANLFDGEEDD